MKLFSVILVVMFFLSACQSNSTDIHIGCQENEISKEGKCFPAEDKNVELFGQDLDSFVESEEVKNGYIAQPIKEGNYPGIIMIHEWWGLNDNIKEMAKILAKEGYVVYAVDLYNGEVAENSDKARELSSSVRSNPEKAIVTMKQAVTYLKERGATKVGSLGWCFGGGQSLQLSLNEDLDATVIYYGNLIDDVDKLKEINSPVLGIFGDKDTGIPVETVKAFESNLNSLGIENYIYIYQNVGHAFANPSGNNYAKNETIDAWEKTVEFLNMNMKS